MQAELISNAGASLTVRQQTMLEGKGTLLPPASVSMPQVL